MDHQFRIQMRRNRHAPCIGDGGGLAQIGQATAHDIGLQDRNFRVLEKRLQIKPGEMAFAANNPRVQRVGDAEIANQ